MTFATTLFASQYCLIVALCVLCFINLLPIAAAMETWYTNDSICGFSVEDAPTGKAKVKHYFKLLLP